MAGYQTDTNVLAKVAQDLQEFAGELDKSMSTYPTVNATPSFPDFGQNSDSGLFPAAHALAGAYAQRAGEHATSRQDLVRWINTMSAVAGILSKRYSTVEELGSASAHDIQNALNQAAAAAAARGGYPQQP
jgi:hypothetical protein